MNNNDFLKNVLRYGFKLVALSYENRGNSIDGNLERAFIVQI